MKESIISAYHNYRVNGMISSGFVIEDPISNQGFYFLADVMEPPNTRPNISARLFDEAGALLVELRANQIINNPGGITQSFMSYGYRLSGPDKKLIMDVNTRRLTNSYMTSLSARLVDEHGRLRMEPQAHGVVIYDAAILGLKNPLFSKD
jgi:hypothetical protein